MIDKNLSTMSDCEVGFATEILCAPSADLPGGVTRGRKNELWKGLGARLRMTRVRAALTPAALCREAKLGSSVVASVEHLEHVPMVDTVERLALVLGVPPGWLAYGADGYEPFVPKRPRRPLPPDDPAPFSHRAPVQNRSASCAERVASARSATGLSMRTLSQAAGLSVQTWSKIENGTATPKVDSLERMAVALDVAPAWLAYGEEELNDTADCVQLPTQN